MNGSVCLVGAGPGDPELLTLKAVRAIRRATVLLVDDLVGDGVLRYARQHARVIHVGKRGNCPAATGPLPAIVVRREERSGLGRPRTRPSTPQVFIEKLMIAEALRGERVVRLKGGDPFVFGRGGEEAEHLRAAGIDVEIVNGMTSGLAAAAALGVPWTHRDHAHGVMLVTGHAREGASAPHWPTLGAAAAQGLTLVVYMGVSQLETITAGLADALPAQTPAALVQAVPTPAERRLVTTLGTLLAAARREGIASPAVLIVGDVLRGCAALAPHAADARSA
ncbi:MAG TPA: uroporphyrinogen-III C-methyltransferase [Burkholderiaceae bacterium]|nr:uroporphyrinogen-III C-methyltransferase [Burkholderiaceae bacterium]